MTFREMTGMGIQIMLIQMVWEIKMASRPNYILVFSALWWIQVIAPVFASVTQKKHLHCYLPVWRS